MSDQKQTEAAVPVAILSTPLGFLVAILIGVALVLGPLVVGLSPHVSLSDSMTVEALIGLVALAVSLIGLVMVTSALGLSTPKAALGLPHGSVRSLLALSLVVIFVVTASWALVPHADNKTAALLITPPYQKTDLPAQIAALQTAFPTPRYAVVPVPAEANSSKLEVIDATGDQHAQELQKQVLTVMATLLTAVVSFYFGGKSASDGSNSVSDTLLKMQSVFGTGAANGKPPAADVAPAPRVAAADLQALGAQISAIADAAAALQNFGGAAPLDLLSEAVQGKFTPEAQSALAAAQTALGALGDAVNAVTTDSSRAKSALAGLNLAAAAPADLKSTRDALTQLLRSATTSKQDADAALAAFTKARTLVLAQTAKG